MKNILSFRIESPKRRDPFAKEVLDRDGPYRPRKVKLVTEYRRKAKHPHRGEE